MYRKSIKFICLLFVAAIVLSQPALAHKSSDSYLTIDATQEFLSVTWEIALQDLENVKQLDNNLDGNVTWKELKDNRSNIANYAKSHLALSYNDKIDNNNTDKHNNSCELQNNEYKINQHSDGAYIVLHYQSDCVVNESNISIDYSLFFDIDYQHRGLLKIKYPNSDSSTVLSPKYHKIILKHSQNNHWQNFFRYIEEGVWHIWIGYDHILFLISLLLPAVLIRNKKIWRGANNLKTVTIDVTKIVTAFTLAHSATLCFVVISGINLPIALTEIIIALSVILVALNNLWPVINGKRWLIAMVFGLIHGFGFANVLNNLLLESNTLIMSLLGFNLGVEIGQLAIVFFVIPCIFIIRNGWFYQKLVFQYGSLAIAGTGFYWAIQRSF